MERKVLMQFAFTEDLDGDRLKAYDDWRATGKRRIDFFRATVDAYIEKKNTADIKTLLKEHMTALVAQLIQSGSITPQAQAQLTQVVDMNIIEKLGL
jgi:hypothetical protein